MFFKLLLAALLAMAPSNPVLSHVSFVAVPEVVVILALGDSITESPDGWTAEFCSQMEAATDNLCDMRNVAVGQTKCNYWPSRINALLVLHEPNLVIMACGTNDDTTTAAGRDALGTAFRQTIESVHTFRSPPILFAPVLIQYSDPMMAPSWVVASQPFTNDTLYSNVMLYNYPSWLAGIVDWQVIPATADYLVGTPYPQEVGLHPTARGHLYAGRLAYDRIALGMGWPISSDPALCGLYGHRRGYGRPTYAPCPMGF